MRCKRGEREILNAYCICVAWQHGTSSAAFIPTPSLFLPLYPVFPVYPGRHPPSLSLGADSPKGRLIRSTSFKDLLTPAGKAAGTSHVLPFHRPTHPPTYLPFIHPNASIVVVQRVFVFSAVLPPSSSSPPLLPRSLSRLLARVSCPLLRGMLMCAQFLCDTFAASINQLYS